MELMLINSRRQVSTIALVTKTSTVATGPNKGLSSTNKKPNSR